MKKFLLAYYTEKLHRYVFDNIYFNNEERRRRRKPVAYTLKERLILKIYKWMVSKNPDFRIKLKYHGKKYVRYNLPDGLEYKK